ncbi:MAG: UDP-N-acetylmuramate dehydrogenase [Chlamydiae bacterium]|nr:UDP-N-acetylmuramate dehydrogenase [Chlamydiota bacterium]
MQLLYDEPLARHSTFGIGGKAKYFIAVTNVDELRQALLFAKQRNLPFFPLGKGSNCLFSDEGFDGLVIENKITHLTIDDCYVTVGSGYSFAYLGEKTAKKGLEGLEFASGIPATVGGAIYMNAGANGKETKDALFEVEYIDENGVQKQFRREEILFRYRYSSFQEMKGMILSAKFLLTQNPLAKQKQKEIITYRLDTQPYKAKTCGCVFQNPSAEKPAGKLIDMCGLKGYKVGGAAISMLHANFIENQENATADDVKKLLEEVQKIVREKTGYDLYPEVCIVPR